MPPDQPTTPNARPRWYRLTPGRLLVLLLAVEGILLLSERWIPKGWAVLIAVAAVAVTMAFMLVWFVVAFLFRWHFQFSIRSLMLLTIVVAVPCSWLTVKVQVAERQWEEELALRKKGATVEYDYQFDPSFSYSIPNATPPAPIWVREILGDNFFINVIFVYLNNSEITDGDLNNLDGHTRITMLMFDHIPITDAGLKHLECLRQLRSLSLKGTRVTDAGIAKLQKALPNCRIER